LPHLVPSKLTNFNEYNNTGAPIIWYILDILIPFWIKKNVLKLRK